MSELKPLAYGYMRIFCDVTDEQVRVMEQRMKSYAEEEGFQYATTFHEFESGSHSAFSELIEELRRADSQVVIVPSYRHLSTNRLLQTSMLTNLDYEAAAEVHALKDRELSGR